MKIKILFLALVAALFTGCKYDDSELRKIVENHEERIGAIEKWKSETQTKLAALQSILTASDHVMNVAYEALENGSTRCTITFVHAQPIVLILDENNQVSGSANSSEMIGVAQDSEGRWYWTLGGQPLQVDNETIYVEKGKNISLATQGDNAVLTIDGKSVTIPQNIPAQVVTAVNETASDVTFTLANGQVVLPKTKDLSMMMQNVYQGRASQASEFALNLPQGYSIYLISPVPESWSVEISGSPAKLMVTYPASGSVKLNFIITDGKDKSTVKTVTFEVSDNPVNEEPQPEQPAEPAITWQTLNYEGGALTAQQINALGDYVRITGDASNLMPPQFSDNICSAIKGSNAKYVDMSSLVYRRAISANAFNMNGVNGKNSNDKLVSVILPASSPAIWGNAFKNCTALMNVTITNANSVMNLADDSVFEGCTSLVSIIVPDSKYDAYIASPAWASVRSKIKKMSEETNKAYLPMNQ